MYRKYKSNKSGESSNGSDFQRTEQKGSVSNQTNCELNQFYNKRDETYTEAKRYRNTRNNGKIEINNERLYSTKVMSYHRLTELIDFYSKNANILLINLNSDKSFFNLISNSERLRGSDGNYKFICHVFRALAIIIDSDPELLNPFLSKLNETQFDFPIVKYLINFNTLLKKDKYLHLNAFENLVKFLLNMQSVLPNASREKVSIISPHLSFVVINCNKKEDIIFQNTVSLVKEIKEHIEKVLEDLTVDDLKEKVFQTFMRPPNDFRKIPICPTVEDIHQTEIPFLRKNIVKGKYENVDHYLDVQFRLLREDFVRPLREGIAEYLDALKNNKQIKKLKDIKVYTGVHIKNINKVGDSLVNEVKFDTTHFRNIRWEFSKRLIYGSMLCLSFNNFETFCFATVVGNRDNNQLSKGKFMLRFESQSLTEEFLKITPMTTFVMIESLAYYESYRHNLAALQKFTENEFPLQDYIIKVSNRVQNLPHLSSQTNYDLTDLLYIQKTRTRVNPMKVKKLECVNMLKMEELLESNDCGLDESQYNALKTALTKQIAVIQGPPGTGKTYLGLRIVQTLLRNEKFWNYHNIRLHSSPILIVCYTNHALDQFLEGMLSFVSGNRGLVRIGGRSQSEKLADYSLFNIKQKMKAEYYDIKREIKILHKRSDNWYSDEEMESTLVYAKQDMTEEWNINYLRKKLESRDNRLIQSLSMCGWELSAIRRELSSLQSNIQNCDQNLLGHELKYLIGKHEIIVEEKLSLHYRDIFLLVSNQLSQLCNYHKDFDFALISWLCVNVYEMGFEEDYEEMDNSEEEIDEINTYLTDEMHNLNIDNGFNREFEANDQEIQYILDNRIIEGEEEYNAMDEEIDTKQRNVTKVLYTEDFVCNPQSLLKKKRIQKQIKSSLNSTDIMSDIEVIQTLDIKQLSNENRWRLYRYWRQLYCQELIKRIKELNKEYLFLEKQFARHQIEVDLYILRECQIIGLTTTGTAKYRTIIEELNPYIVVVEEAAEVLESHVVTSLTKNTKHLILIGDHQQLKPNPTVYELAKKYNLEISLFERMIKNGLPYNQLKLQHRMRPEISSLLVPHIYKELKDHDSVKQYDNIKGISKNMFFINHSENESTINDTKSKLNKYEAEFIVSLCHYLINQDYKPSQITIIVMYSAQLFEVKKYIKLDPKLAEVRAVVLDNYQGEECDIILLSFVRSNSEGEIGFLSVSNRVNVALSRARMGMYCIGNFKCLSESSDLWKSIRNDLIKEKAIGSALELICEKHRTKTLISKAYDFKQVPEGGCLKPCDYRLDCGHVCPHICHNYDNEHKKVICPKICGEIVCNLEHKCMNRCHYQEKCEPCSVPLKKTRTVCGHEIITKCSIGPNETFCKNLCEKSLICGHKCPQYCSIDCSSVKCKEMVKIVAICKHRIEIECWKRSNIDLQLKYCTEECNSLLICGHKCEGSCGECHQKRFHRLCQKKCERTLICGHNCQNICGMNCQPCEQNCKSLCFHDNDKRKCGLPYGLCKEVWKCAHKTCERFCSDREVCNESCNKKLECKHRCIGICGEKCPTKCRICDKDEVEELVFGNENKPNAKFIQLKDCGHVIEFVGLSKWLTQTHIESQLSNQNTVNIVEIQMKRCPKCKIIIRNTKLFNSCIRESLRDVESVKLIYRGDVEENKRRALHLKEELVNYYHYIGGNDLQSMLTLNRNYKEVNPLPKNELILTIIGPKIKHLIFEISYKHKKQDIMLMENKFDVMKKISDFKYHLLNAKNKRDFNKNFDEVIEFIDLIDNRMDKFLNFIHKSFANNDQQINDIKREMSFFPLISETINALNKMEFNEEERKLLINAFELFSDFNQFTDDINNKFKELIGRVVKVEKELGLSHEQKNIVLNALDFQKGNWFKCKFGHIYCIKECVSGHCPEC